ncbi:ATP-NAD kinase family protein [Anaeromicrobium sediminis]|uniref:ATP-NAD kinase n=1 Tax=Anaeromicrobium sediminis TaxID=1478221 RepID=A0A267MHS9_9FIRM|nr:ATP-NAD kinase family protein [Anaeromicrobium sediminis]PAB58488.1 ATP-NAD kinase [Anaeromicrobium sediminis]
MKKIGFIINPIAGMGGRVGLKGTDGMVEKAIELGAIPQAPIRAKKALVELLEFKDSVQIVTAYGEMGESIAKDLGFNTKTVYNSLNLKTSCEDTIKGARKIIKENIDILIFAGGDGTARDIFTAVGLDCVTIGIPAGVKIHSPVYAQNPRKAGELVKKYLNGKIGQVNEVEVLDIDEKAYRKGIVNTQLYGYLNIPYEKNFTQNRKAPSPLSEKANQNLIALDIIDNMKEDTLYIIGPGTTTRAIMENLNLPNSLLGVDIVMNKNIVKKDVTEKDILKEIKSRKCKLILTPTGGQGYILGRGNHQISPSVIEHVGRNNIIIASTSQKITSLYGRPLMVDTGNEEIDKSLSGYMRITIGYGEYTIYPVKC